MCMHTVGSTYTYLKVPSLSLARGISNALPFPLELQTHFGNDRIDTC